jgi:hypothetical protein
MRCVSSFVFRVCCFHQRKTGVLVNKLVNTRPHSKMLDATGSAVRAHFVPWFIPTLIQYEVVV